MDFGAIGVVYLPIFIVFACVFYLQRWNRYRRRRNKGFYPTYSSLGNAFQEMQKIALPPAAHVVQEKLDERVEEDDESGPKNPTEPLRRRLKRIRNGEKIDDLKLFRAPPD
ncbi:MAG: hypothetical protein ACLP3R_27240 [Candidatus Korobacteraceae bacterium]